MSRSWLDREGAMEAGVGDIRGGKRARRCCGIFHCLEVGMASWVRDTKGGGFQLELWEGIGIYQRGLVSLIVAP
jgi:hypothetical protein